MDSIKDEILNYLISSNDAFSLTQIAEIYRLSASSTHMILEKLVKDEKIKKFITNKGTYYIHSKNATYDDLSNMHYEITKETTKAKDQYEDLNSEINLLKEKLGRIYLDIISLMAIFVAVFSFISINTSIVFQLSKNNQYDVFRGIIITNLSLAITLVLLITLIRLIIVNPLVTNKKVLISKKDKVL